MYKYELTVVMVSYNTRELTCTALTTLDKETRASFETIVVDNQSSDASADEIEHSFPKIRLIRARENLGFASGNNLAVREATGEYILLLNPDTEVLEGAVDNLLEFARSNPNAMIWGGKTLFADGTLNPASCWSRQTCWSLVSQALGFSSIFRRSTFFNPEGIGGWNRNGEREVDIVSGCFLMIKKEFWDHLGGFHPDFFMYGEEADLCLRAGREGARPAVTSTATIVHHGGASEKIRVEKLIRLIKAKKILIRRHFGPLTRSLGLFLLDLWPLSRLIVHAVLTTIGYSKSKEARDVWFEVLQRQFR